MMWNQATDPVNSYIWAWNLELKDTSRGMQASSAGSKVELVFYEEYILNGVRYGYHANE